MMREELMEEFRLESSLSLSGPVDLSETNNEWISLMNKPNSTYDKFIKKFQLTNGHYHASTPTWMDPNYGLHFDPFNWKNESERPYITVDIFDDLMPGNHTFDHTEGRRKMTAEEKLDADFDTTFDVDIYPRNSEIRNTVEDICLVGYKFMDLDLPSFLICPRLKRLQEQTRPDKLVVLLKETR
ncbi:hypothetical protein RHMOL_Rhmol03G0064800 [Rhododendron molle]|uniref:Uncharacterized protein n=1 Tax=Rhododendron molle TaxID=49168 RepID=A0ACC0PCF1_RHOML|nr:hypothetical protein RHMOL_Rhmol03G0064800 [Rhododendron molle]